MEHKPYHSFVLASKLLIKVRTVWKTFIPLNKIRGQLIQYTAETIAVSFVYTFYCIDRKAVRHITSKMRRF